MRMTCLLLCVGVLGCGDAKPVDSGAGCPSDERAGFLGVDPPSCADGTWTLSWQMEGRVQTVVLNVFDLATPSVEELGFADDIAVNAECGTADTNQSKTLVAEGNPGNGGTRLACDRVGDPQVIFALRHLAEAPEDGDCIVFGWDPDEGAAVLDSASLTDGIPTWADTASQCRWLSVGE